MTSATPPPGSRLPSWIQTALYLAAPGRSLRAARRRHGPVFQARFLGFPPQTYVTTAELAQQVYAVDAGGGRAGEVRRQFLEGMVGRNSLLTLDGDPWWRHRRLLSPPLHGKAIADYGDEIARIAAEHIAEWPRHRPFALRDRMQEITLEVILRLVFGIRDNDRLARLRTAIPELIEVGGSPVMLMLPPRVRAWTQSPPATRLGFLPTTRFQRARDAVDAMLFDEIAHRRTEPVPGATDVLSRLLQARDEQGRPMSDQELRDELITMLEAGHETTATALAWTFERLLRTPAVLAELREEIDDGRHTTYLDAVVKEALRSRPVVYEAPRLLDEPLQLGRFRVPAGSFASPVITLIHHDPEVFPEPSRFRPERFLGPDAARAQRAWMPFGGGRRYCVGAQLAVLEMTVIIREVLTRLELTAPDPTPERPRARHVTLIPAKRTVVVARPRDSAVPPEGLPARRAVTVRREVAAAPAVVWAALADITRMGEWSPECTGGSWLGARREPVVGARFLGTNRKGLLRWTTRCTITDARPGRAIAWDTRLGIPLAHWSFVLSPTPTGTLVEQTWRDRRVGPLGTLMTGLSEAALRTGPRADHNEQSMRATLSALERHLKTQ
ncbi:cytochrome P450 [Embleya sp. NPDC050154]|uniref:cytochrome P450 n=1 Tax=Embleya sp. NPDC050154 TaxID=3363988 RepID=UPI0037AE964C